jgi:DNA-binding PadR family transcriptional regulator
LEVEVYPRKDRLPRKVYYITDLGQDELQRWLTTPLDLPVHRQSFLLQLHFGSKLRDDEILKLIENERIKVQQRLDTVSEIYAMTKGRHELFENSRQSFYHLLATEHAISINTAYRDWLQNCTNRIELGDYSPKE